MPDPAFAKPLPSPVVRGSKARGQYTTLGNQDLDVNPGASSESRSEITSSESREEGGSGGRRPRVTMVLPTGAQARRGPLCFPLWGREWPRVFETTLPTGLGGYPCPSHGCPHPLRSEQLRQSPCADLDASCRACLQVQVLPHFPLIAFQPHAARAPAASNWQSGTPRIGVCCETVRKSPALRPLVKWG